MTGGDGRVAAGNALAYKQLGDASRATGDLQAAVASYRRAVELAPEHVPALYNLAVALRDLNQLGEAEKHFRRLHDIDPQDGDALFHLGTLLREQSRYVEAVPFLRLALRLRPDNALLWWNLGVALANCREFGEARNCLEKAVQIEPEFHDARFHLGHVYSLLGMRDLAVACYRRVHGADPDNRDYLDALTFEAQKLCDWPGLDALWELRRRADARQASHPVSPFAMLSSPASRAELLDCAKTYAQAKERAVDCDRERLDLGAALATDGRIRIGYLSADFHEHATAYLMAELLELHDRGDFEVTGYSYGPDDGSAMRERLRKGFDRFVDLTALSHADAAAAIHADRIGILVDLKGYTFEARSEILALRPAPLQVSYLGYPGTMGAKFIDYLVVDRFVVPRSHAADYSEKLVVLPGSYQVNDRKRRLGDLPGREELALPLQGFVFCCFNQPYKILPDVFAVWMRLLRTVPQSVLWLLEWNRWSAQNLRQEARKAGVAPERLVFAPRLPVEDHLGRIQAADLFLDTFPYGAHTTASDALWAGVPVLTCAGETFASRVAGSLLTALDVPELIVHSMIEYEMLAARLALNSGELKSLRDKVSRNRLTTALFDTPTYVRHLEAAYREMWANRRAGNPPRTIEVPE